MSFDAYAFHGGFDRVAVIAHDTRALWNKTGEFPDDLVTLRTALFFVQRAGHDDLNQSTDDPYLSGLLEAIRVRAPTKGSAA